MNLKASAIMNSIRCPNCNHPLKYPDRFASKKAKCRQCGHPFRLPPLPTDKSSEVGLPTDPAQASGAALARLFNTLGENASQSDNPETAGQEAAQGFAALLTCMAENQKRQKRQHRVDGFYNALIGAGMVLAGGAVTAVLSAWFGDGSGKGIVAVGLLFVGGLWILAGIYGMITGRPVNLS